MKFSVSEAAKQIELRGLLRRDKKDTSERVIDRVRQDVGRELPDDLKAFYRERVTWIGHFWSIYPTWNDWVGWRPLGLEMTALLHVDAIPLFDDGFGNIWGLDLPSDNRTPAVYFFDHEREFDRPQYAAGSSLATFLLLLAEHEEAFKEGRPAGWELAIDPDIDKCPRAPPIWLAD